MTTPDDEGLIDGCELPFGALRPGAIPRELGDALLERTMSVVHCRRRLRRVAAVALALLVFGAGGLLGYGIGRDDASREDDSRSLALQAEGMRPPAAPVSVEDLEARAREAGDGEKAVLLKEAGDRYLTELQDVTAAARCYRAHLTTLDPHERSKLERSDTWLLASLRLDP